MSRKPDPELLSAYLDGQLSAQEKALVEQWLARDPAARQLCDRLRRQQALLRSLPRRKVPRDLAATVLQQAEERIILQGEGSPQLAGKGARRAGRETAALSLPRVLRRVFQPRNLGWAILAASIGLIIYLVFPQPNRPGRDRDVAFMAKEKMLVEEQGPSARPSADRTEQAARDLFSGPGLTLGVEPAQPVEEQMMGAGAESPGTLAASRAVPEAQEARASSAEPPPLVIERVRPFAAPGAMAPGAATMRRMGPAVPSKAADEELVIECQLAASASPKALAQQVVARHLLTREDVDPWALAGHTERRGSPAEVDTTLLDTLGVPPGIRMELVGDGESEKAVLEFTASPAVVRAIVADLQKQSQVVRDVQLPPGLVAGDEAASPSPAAQDAGVGGGAKALSSPSAPAAQAPTGEKEGAQPSGQAKPAEYRVRLVFIRPSAEGH